MNNEEFTLTREQQVALARVAAMSIMHGLLYQKPLPIVTNEYPRALQVPRGVFVTLKMGRKLRGCVGTWAPSRPLVANVSAYAHAAAFSDSRFPQLNRPEFPQVQIQISVLSRLEPMSIQSEAELVNQLRPGVDGLLLEDTESRGTFLPSVWADIPQPAEFVRRLKLKAGLAADYWSETLRASRYTTFCFGELAL